MNHALPSEPAAGTLRALFLGDVFGEGARTALNLRLETIKEERRVDFTVVNGENAAGGRGLTPRLAIDLMRQGAAVVTTGDHVWDQREFLPWIDSEPRVLRPANWGAGVPGQGDIVLETKKGPVAVLNLMGRTFMKIPVDNPFTVAQERVEALRKEAAVILVDFHAETTSEKMAMGWHLDGKASLVIGTHTHIATADTRILPEGTAFQCDAGMCGPENSVIGSERGPIIERFLNGLPQRHIVAKGPIRLNGILVDVSLETGRAVGVERFTELCEIPD